MSEPSPVFVPSQLRIINVTGFTPYGEDGALFLRVLYGQIDLELYDRQIPLKKTGKTFTTHQEVTAFLERLYAVYLSRTYGEEFSCVLTFHMNERLGEMVNAIRRFRDAYLAGRPMGTPRLSILERTGRNLLFLQGDQARSEHIQQLIANFGGVVDGPLGQGGILMTPIGALLTITCSPGEKTVPGQRFRDFLSGDLPLPVVRSGIRARTPSGRLTRPPPVQTPDHEAKTVPWQDIPTSPGFRASWTPPPAEPYDDTPTIEVHEPRTFPSAPPKERDPDETPVPSSRPSRPLRLTDLPIPSGTPHRQMPAHRMSLSAAPPPPLSRPRTLHPPPKPDRASSKKGRP